MKEFDYEKSNGIIQNQTITNYVRVKQENSVNCIWEGGMLKIEDSSNKLTN